MNNSELKEFILKASRATYASGDSSMRIKQPDGSTTINYSSGDYVYHDNYFGGEPYGGREVVFYKNNPIWMMVYYGFVLPGMNNGEVYGFLTKALSNSTVEMPYRGPEKYEEGEWIYENNFSGDVEKFSGTEKICKSGMCIYEASYIGGAVDKK